MTTQPLRARKLRFAGPCTITQEARRRSRKRKCEKKSTRAGAKAFAGLPSLPLNTLPSHLKLPVGGLLGIVASGFALLTLAHAGTTNYSYDAFGRLSSVATSNGSRSTYTYDQADNRTQLIRIAHNRAITSPHDFDADGHSDLWWRNQNTGDLTVWRVTANNGGYQLITNTYGHNGVPTDWKRQATVDYNGDGRSDFLWRHPTTGEVSIWNSTAEGGFAPNSHNVTNMSAEWKVSGVADYNGDGKADLFWRHDDGRFSRWHSTGSGYQQGVLNGGVDPAWRVVGEGDFNGDGKGDLLWRNSGTGEVTKWTATDTDFINSGVLNTVSTDWQIAAVGDYTGDGKADLFWRQNGGALRVWRSNGQGFDQAVYGHDGVPSSWRVLRVADFNADGKADILWREQGGAFSVWQSTGNGYQPNVIEGFIPPEWVLFGDAYNPSGTV